MSGSTTRNFKSNAARELANDTLRAALTKSKGHFTEGRSTAAENLPEFEALRDQSRDIKNHTIEHLDFYLEAYEEKVRESGGHVHWARTAEDARQIVLEICRSVDAKAVNKGKSMISEECEINEMLEANGIRAIETDLGEYIIQLRGEKPSHIIAPAVHLTKGQVEESFRANHTHLDPDRVLEEPPTLLDEARTILRKKYFEAEVGMTGANLLIAETGSSVIVTNEGNGDLSQLIPKVHIVLASVEKIVPTLEDAATILRVLARSATGQEFSSYTTLSTGPKREGDTDGPEQYHVILLDNGRTDMIGTEFQEMLRCIRCGACQSACPVYGAVGGHARVSVVGGGRETGAPSHGARRRAHEGRREALLQRKGGDLNARHGRAVLRVPRAGRGGHAPRGGGEALLETQPRGVALRRAKYGASYVFFRLVSFLKRRRRARTRRTRRTRRRSNPKSVDTRPFLNPVPSRAR